MHDQATRRIEDLALIGSTSSAGMVRRDGTIVWLCMPRFDSEAMFASLLGDPGNGEWALHATAPDAVVTRRYVDGTVILETRIETADGVAVVTDFMPLPAEGGTHELVRIVRGERGVVTMETDLRLRFGYGAACPWVRRNDDGLTAIAGPDGVRVTCDGLTLENADFTSRATFDVAEGATATMLLEWFPSHIDPPAQRDPAALLTRETEIWRQWRERSTYRGPHADLVERSLLTLKALTYAPTGGIVAAATTSLPESIAGARNWDYRFCWLRDAALTLYALLQSGFREEAKAWRLWLMRAVGGSPGQLQIMYGILGERRLPEQELDWLKGFEGSRPVRVGNAAFRQRQLDVYGSLIGAFDASCRAGLDEIDDVWRLQCALVEQLATGWREPDSGLWEVRGPLRHFVHSKAMCWFAFDRMIATAETLGLDGPVDQWRAARDEIHAQVCERGFDRASNSFVQSYDADAVEAALLLLPLLGFLPVDDPRIQGTIARIERDLLRDGLVLRYLPERTDDGLVGKEGAFLACSYWLCHVYAVAGRTADAAALFDRLARVANDLGLLAEEYDSASGCQLGNFPQAFSHVALINAAFALDGTTGASLPSIVR